jgi:hypothetical protein
MDAPLAAIAGERARMFPIQQDRGMLEACRQVNGGGLHCGMRAPTS